MSTIMSPNDEVFVLDEQGNKLGKMPMSQARNMAYQAGLDLVEIQKQENLSVYKIMDEGKWRYLQKKKAHKHKQHHFPDKEMKFRLSIDSHDQETKIRQVSNFLEKGHKVKLSVQYRHREIMGSPSLAADKLQSILSQIGEYKHSDTRKYKEKNGERLEVYMLPHPQQHKAEQHKVV